MHWRCGTNLFHRWKVGSVNVAFLHIRQTIAVNLVRSNPAPTINPISWIVKQMRFLFLGRLLVAHVLVQSPFSKQGHDLVDIKVGERGFGRHVH